MTVYKRPIWKFFTSLLLAPLAPAAVAFIIMWLLQYFPYTWLYYLMYILPAIIFLLMLYNTFWGDNIRFEVTDTGQLEYYKRGKLRKSFNLKTADIGYHHVKDSNGGTHSLRMRITDAEGKTEILDCEALGSRKFHKMFEQAQSFCEGETHPS